MVARNKVVLGGALPGGERWAVTQHYAGDPGTLVQGGAALSTWANNIMTGLTTMSLTALRSALGTQSGLNSVTCYEYGATGPAVAVGVNTPGVQVVGTGDVQNPLPTAIVVSLRTATAGASYRGRFYWPGPAAGITTAGKFLVSSAGAQGYANEAAAILTMIGTAPANDAVRCVIYSPTKDLVTPVTSVLVGDIPDTQRSRRDGLTEVYYTGTYTAP